MVPFLYFFGDPKGHLPKNDLLESDFHETSVG